MTSSRRLRFTAEARRDLRSILRYTLRTWGERQRDVYAEQLTDALRELTRFPDLGRPHDEIAPGLRALPIGQHIAYYRVEAQTVSIVRLLHTKMAVTGQFNQGEG